MTKKEVQQRVLQNGKKIALNKFNWDEKTNTFSSIEGNLVVDFNGFNNCTFKTGYDCTFDTNSSCTFKTSYNCIFKTGSSCTFDTDSSCIFDTGSSCTFKTSYNCTFKTSYNCTFKTGSSCTFDTGSSCTFDTGSSCTFKTSYNCTFKTGYDCTFDTNSSCYINNLNCFNCVLILRYDNKKEIYDLNTFANIIKFEIGKEPITKPIIETKLIDNEIYIINNKHSFKDYNVMNCQEISDYFNDVDKFCKVVSKGKYNAHCETIEKGIEDINFKIARETASLGDIAAAIKEKGNIINWYDYRLITGACELGTKNWLEENELTTDDTFKISDFYNNQKNLNPYGFGKFKEFYDKYFGC